MQGPASMWNGASVSHKELGDLTCRVAQRMLAQLDEGKRAEDVLKTLLEKPSPRLWDSLLTDVRSRHRGFFRPLGEEGVFLHCVEAGDF